MHTHWGEHVVALTLEVIVERISVGAGVISESKAMVALLVVVRVHIGTVKVGIARSPEAHSVQVLSESQLWILGKGDHCMRERRRGEVGGKEEMHSL
jgi:hypothetical protein